ncbi:MAG: hypothetical protein IPK18_08435 [Sphingobacteriales bacterium]|nr:MAG: hypothetical protein IPK18_08435 [Sphingobacteriales bacterium]
MKKLILILMVVLVLASCKKSEKCLVGKWTHVKSVCNGRTQSINENYIITITENSFINGKTNEIFNDIVITDDMIGNLQYSCDGKVLKIKYNYCLSENPNSNDGSFDKNYEEYKR